MRKKTEKGINKLFREFLVANMLYVVHKDGSITTFAAKQEFKSELNRRFLALLAEPEDAPGLNPGG